MAAATGAGDVRGGVRRAGGARGATCAAHRGAHCGQSNVRHLRPHGGRDVGGGGAWRRRSARRVGGVWARRAGVLTACWWSPLVCHGVFLVGCVSSPFAGHPVGYLPNLLLDLRSLLLASLCHRFAALTEEALDPVGHVRHVTTLQLDVLTVYVPPRWWLIRLRVSALSSGNGRRVGVEVASALRDHCDGSVPMP